MLCGAIILAAGPSSRMGKSKQMLDIDGEPLLCKCVNTVVEANIDHIVVVLGANEDQHRKLLDGADVDITYNVDWQRGMGSSIRAGLQTLLSKYPDTSSVIILVCDQPLLTSDVIANLRSKQKESEKPIVCSRYDDVPGVPVLFDARYFDKLMRLPDDQGAKKIILQHSSDVASVSFPGGEIDLDTREDYEAFTGTRAH